MDTLKLEIVTPDRIVAKEEVDMMEARGIFGDFGILPGHTQFVTRIDVGEIRYMKDGVTKHISTSGGFAEIVEDEVLILLDTAEFAEEIDIDRAKRAKEKAEEFLRTMTIDAKDYRMQELALYRAIARISVYSKRL